MFDYIAKIFCSFKRNEPQSVRHDVYVIAASGQIGPGQYSMLSFLKVCPDKDTAEMIGFGEWFKDYPDGEKPVVAAYGPFTQAISK
jgi:hypothetical protein